MVTSIAILVGLALFSAFMFLVLIVAGIMLLRGKKAAPKKAAEQPWPFQAAFEPPVQVKQTFREQINAEKADAIAKLYADLTEKQFMDETIAEAKKLFETA